MPSLPAVEWPILDLSQSPGQIFWLMTYLCPVRPTCAPSSLLVKSNSFDHWDVVDGCPSRGKCAVSRDLCSLVTVKIFCSRCQRPDWTSSPSAETGKAASSAAFDRSWWQECGEYGLGWPVMLRRCLCVEGRAFKKRVSKIRFGLFYG